MFDLVAAASRRNRSAKGSRKACAACWSRPIDASSGRHQASAPPPRSLASPASCAAALASGRGAQPEGRLEAARLTRSAKAPAEETLAWVGALSREAYAAWRSSTCRLRSVSSCSAMLGMSSPSSRAYAVRQSPVFTGVSPVQMESHPLSGSLVSQLVAPPHLREICSWKRNWMLSTKAESVPIGSQNQRTTVPKQQSKSIARYAPPMAEGFELHSAINATATQSANCETRVSWR
mmetsp:Transcript_21429/g.37782  ORF Transcript_21429/g.37782 Transcript_21429/m.37782 type:complete len:235 (-) Transcript_21429:114-818(-)